MINTLRSNYDHLLASPFNTKKGNPGLPTIECTIRQQVLHNAFCDLGSGVSIMSKVTYDNLIGEPLLPTYTQLQMADQTIRFPDGIAKDIFVKIQDDYVPADFMILDMGIDEEIPLILGRPFLNTTNAVIFVGSGQIHFQFPGWKVKRALNGYTTNKQVKKNCQNRRHHAILRQRNQLAKNRGEEQVE